MATEPPRFLSTALADGIRRLKRRRIAVLYLFIALLALVIGGVVTWQQSVWLLIFALAGAMVPLGDDLAVAQSAARGDETARTIRVINGLLAGVPDAVIVLDRATNVLAWNAAAQKIAPALAAGSPLSLALRSADLIAAVRRAAAANKAERIEFQEHVPIDAWWDVHVLPVDLGGPAQPRNEFIVLTLQDQAPLRRVEEMRTNFVANVSHELRTPLASVLGFVETLQGPARDDVAARDRFLGIMKEQAMRMKRLIDDLLSLSRAELGASVQPEQIVDVVNIVRQVADGLRPLAQDREVTIRIDAQVEPLNVRGDHDELVRVFENLIENALKYGGTGKKVDVTLTRAAERTARISVRDYGPGIAAEHLPRLTERFYRVDVLESRAQGGTGLGLALVKHILNRHRGRLTIESEPGQGATFTVELPEAGDIHRAA
jgi:two-component system, OmpR family, phosphate regulon sensor histidine kinase PhoR